MHSVNTSNNNTTAAPGGGGLLENSNNNRMVFPLSMVDLNNTALSYFLRGDYDHAVELFRMSLDLCHNRQEQTSNLQAAPNTTSSTSSAAAAASSVSDYDGSDEDDEGEEDHSMTMDDADCSEDGISTSISSSASSSSSGKRGRGSSSRTTSQEDSQSMSTDTPDHNRTNGPLSCCFSFSSDGAPAAPAPSNNTASPNTAFTMYNRALILTRNDEQDAALLRTRAILLYNLALVYHNVGIHRGVSAALWQALRLYEMALETLDKHVPAQPADDEQQQQHAPASTAGVASWMWRLLDVEKLLLALLNNMGNIHAHLFHLENTHACMNSLRMVLEASTATTNLLLRGGNSSNSNSSSSTTTSSSNPPRIVATMDEDHMFFLLNSLFQGKELCFAPAA